ncbi:hypothetical protein [Rhizobium binxianense]|uniref:hypothetical protein n=1 Tax=Rhizobium binxianense TaxID=3024242 RepID=UPI00235E6FF5|nr:hypothetical protein [Rhizobium sp. MJ37]MDC9834324.1 hypothetical protein [Rhizobium sp. MJ37]
MAASYCGISSELFTQLCPVKPISLTDSAWGQRYLRQRLDEWLFSLDPNDSATLARKGVAEQTHGGVMDASSSEIQMGAGGYPIMDDPTHPLKKYYDDLGFDPRTMDENDMERLMAANRAQWEASIPSSRLGKREVKALEFFAAIGANIRVNVSDVKNCGPDTEDRLKIRGFIETFPHQRFPNQSGYYMLTDAGLAAWKKLK